MLAATLHAYPPPSLSAVDTVLSVYHALARYETAVRAATEPLRRNDGGPEPVYHLGSALRLLVNGGPQGSISAPFYSGERNVIVAIGGLGQRMETQALLVLKSLTLFDRDGPYVAADPEAPQRRVFTVPHGQDDGIPFHRLLAGAYEDEVVKLGDDGQSIFAENVTIEPGSPRCALGREEAICHALMLYDDHAGSWGLAGRLTRGGYRQLLRGAFTLYDAANGRHFLRDVA